MTERENFFHLMAGGSPERVPFTLKLCDSLLDQFRAKYGVDDYLGYYEVPFAYASPLPSRYPIDYSVYFAPGEIDFFDNWGFGYKKGRTAHFASFISPMREFSTPEEVWNYPMEDYLAEYRWEDMRDRVCALKQKDRIVVTGGPTIDLFEPSWYLRGMENLLCDFLLEPEMANACLERTLEVKCGIAARFAAAGVDVIIYGDDVGTERDMMISPELWRKWLKPRLIKMIRAAKEVNPDVLCYYHSDGDIRLIIDELIECGIDILNPVQPECMDPTEIYRRYSDRIALWGTIGTQTTMPFGSVEDVRVKTREMLDLCRETGRLILAPTHLLEPEVPLENVDAFVDTVKNF